MNAPPRNIDASELFTSLSAVPKPHRIVDFPATNPKTGESVGKVAIVPLSQEETNASRQAAETYVKSAFAKLGAIPKDGDMNLAYQATYTDECLVQFLWRALKDANDPNLDRPAIPNTRDVRSFAPNTIAVLANHYFRACSECGPLIYAMSADEMDAWLKRLEEGASLFPLDLLSSEQRDLLLMRSASRQRSSVMGSSSCGSPADGSTSSPPMVDEPPPAPSIDDVEAPHVDSFNPEGP